MKTKEFKELKTKTKEDLLKTVKAKKLEIIAITGKIYAGREKNLTKARVLRKEVAQMMTLINRKETK